MGGESAHGGDYEHGWQALRGLAGRASACLTQLRARSTFTPVARWEMVLVQACPLCADGGLRMAGYITYHRQLLPVRQCDTCSAVAVGTRFVAGARSRDAVAGQPDDTGDETDDTGDGDEWRRFH